MGCKLEYKLLSRNGLTLTYRNQYADYGAFFSVILEKDQDYEFTKYAEILNMRLRFQVEVFMAYNDPSDHDGPKMEKHLYDKFYKPHYDKYKEEHNEIIGKDVDARLATIVPLLDLMK